MDAIKNNQGKFDRFLKTVKGRNVPSNIKCPAEDSACFYGDKEKQLKPTKEHLKKLVDHIAKNDYTKKKSTNGNRMALYGQSETKTKEEAKDEALKLIDQVYDNDTLPKAWYIFEGPTNPDIFIECDEYVIVCEGKWTEPHITTKTTHLNQEHEKRNQMIRHIQGALNYTNKKIIAFYIVDENCSYKNDLECEAFESHLNKETIKLSDEEKERIRSSFYGYTIWQRLETELGIKFKTKEEIDQERQLSKQ